MFTFKLVNAVTKLVLNSGKSSLMNMESTLRVLIMEILIFNSKESMFTIMKLPVVDLFQELFLWISNQEQWIPLELDHLVNFSDQITLFLDRLVLVTIGQKDIILKVLNLLILYLMLLEKKLKDVIASKVSKYATPSVVVLDPVWVHFLSLKSEKNIQIES